MSTARSGRRLAGVAIAAAAAMALSACASGNPITSGSSPASSGAADSIVVGSQAYYSNEIIAEIYAQALEANGFDVTRKFNIGQREAYIPALESGEVQLFPEYTGNLLQYYDKDSTAKTAEGVYAALQNALPSSLVVLKQSPATDQDSYNVTQELASKYSLTSIGDLASVPQPVALGGAAELGTREYGVPGLQSVYGVSATLTPIASPELVAESLKNGTVQVANVYSADPSIGIDHFVTLADPKGLFLPSNVVPLVSKSANSDRLDAVIDKVSAAMTPQDLVALNVKSVQDKESADDIAREWLAQKNLF